MLTKFVSTLLDAVDALVVVLDQHERIVHFNRICEQTTDYSFDEVEGRYLWDLLVPEEVDPVKAIFNDIRSNLVPNSYESYWITKNGSNRLITWSNNILLDAQGSIEYIVGTGRDITDTRKTEEKIKVSENNYRAIFEAANDTIFVHDLSTLEMLDVNQKVYEMYGYTPEEMLQLTINDISLGEPPYTQAEAAQFIIKSITTGQPQIFEWRTKHKNGQLGWVEINLKPAVIGGRGCLLVISRDINERMLAEKALRQSEAQLRQQALELQETLQELKQAQIQLIQTEKMSSLGQLVAGIAHEINNPVNFIYGNISYASEYIQKILNLVELYQQYYPNPVVEIKEELEEIELDFLIEDLTKLLKSMRVGTERIREIVLSLRNFSRLDEADMKPVNIHEGIDSTLLILQNRLKVTGSYPAIEIVKKYGNLPLVECYAGQLNQVFMNIIANALDSLDNYNRQRSLEAVRANPSRITIYTEVLRPGFVTVRIADNGPGMTEEIKQRLFDPFFTTKPVGKGTGLGLSISYQIVINKHGGNLQCISAPGEGAEFIIEIPIRQ